MAELVGFQKRGCAVWLIAPRESIIFQRAEKLGVPTVAVKFKKFSFLPNIIRLARWLRRERIEVLNPHSSRDGWVLGFAGRLARVPFIVRTRHIDVDYPNAMTSRIVFTKLADHVLTTSDKITRHFQKIFQLPDNRITTQPTGIDLDLFSPAGARAELPGKTSDAPLIGMVSVLRSWKGHQTFLEASAHLKAAGCNARFVIVGEGPSGQRIKEKCAN